MNNPLVVVTEDYAPEPIAWLKERCEVVRADQDDPRFPSLLARAAGLAVRTYTRVDAALLDRAPALRVVGRAGVALENIDVPACRARSVEVVHTPAANTRAVVEFFTALLLDALRARTTVVAPVAPDDWTRMRNVEYADNRQLDRLTLGVWGFGRIGSGVARVARALDMRVIYHDIREIPEPSRHGAGPAPLNDLLRESDVVTLHVDFRESNRHIVNAASLAKMKPDAVFINTSRGFCVDPAALAAWLRAHPAAKAMIDVHDPHEPIGADYPLLGVPNAVLTPHIAAGTREAKINMSWVVRDIWRVLSGEPPEFPAPALH